MIHSINTVGIHVILMPNSTEFVLPKHCAADLTAIAQETAALSGCTFKTLHVCADHVHVLFVSSDEQAVNTFLPTFAERLREYLAESDVVMRAFDWNERLHVTLLPPWHVEILASFVRDQDTYHQTRTLQQELDEVFLPNIAMMADAGPTSNHHPSRLN